LNTFFGPRLAIELFFAVRRLLQPAKIVFGLKGEFSQVIETLCKRSAIPGLSGQLRNKTTQRDEERFSYIGDGIAIPHLRVDNLQAPELILGLSREGITFKSHVVKIVLFLVTPASNRLNICNSQRFVPSPAIRNELLANEIPPGCLVLAERSNNQPSRPTLILQEQIAFELQSNLINGLTREEAARLVQYGPNLLRQAYRIPGMSNSSGTL
jgi:hypothetical protein